MMRRYARRDRTRRDRRSNAREWAARV